MDRPPEEMQHLGFLGIFKESFKIIWKYKRILSLIVITLIFPLALICLAETHYSMYLRYKLYKVERKLDHVEHGTPKYNHLVDILTSERIAYCMLKIVYYIVMLIFSLLSTSAVVYLVACVYTVKAITYKKVMSVVPQVWKRLAVTFFWIFIISLVYNLSTLGLYVILFGIFGRSTPVALTIIITVFIAHFVGFVYLCIIWYLGSVVSVLEENCGIEAMAKAKDLVKGKRRVVAFIFLLLGIVYYGVYILYDEFVAFDWNLGRIFIVGVPCVLLLTLLFLLGLVVQSVIYFVCKSYHYEHIDKSALSEHLDAFLPEYMPLKESKDVQLQQVYV